MADNSTQAGADTIRDKDRAGVKTQIVGLDLGIGTGTENLMAGSMPVTGTGTAGTPATGVQTVQGITSGTPVPVSGTFFQATQPVSLATAPTTPVTGTFWQATQPVSLATAPTTPVTGTFWQATQPVSMATNTPTIAAGTNQIGTIGELRASTLAVTATAALTTAATATLPAVVGQFHYITAVTMSLYSAAARTGAAAPWVVTTTNLPGTPAWTFSTAGAIGTNETQTFFPATPLRSSVANTATTVVGPAATGGIWRIVVSYFTAA